MPEITVGLAPNRNSYYDDITNVYITLKKPVQTIMYETSEELENITHALFSSNPALVLYKGKIPKEAIDRFKNEYRKPFHTNMKKLVRNLVGDLVPPSATPNGALDRPDIVNEKSVDNEMASASLETDTEVFQAESFIEDEKKKYAVKQEEIQQVEKEEKKENEQESKEPSKEVEKRETKAKRGRKVSKEDK